MCVAQQDRHIDGVQERRRHAGHVPRWLQEVNSVHVVCHLERGVNCPLRFGEHKAMETLTLLKRSLDEHVTDEFQAFIAVLFDASDLLQAEAFITGVGIHRVTADQHQPLQT